MAASSFVQRMLMSKLLGELVEFLPEPARDALVDLRDHVQKHGRLPRLDPLRSAPLGDGELVQGAGVLLADVPATANVRMTNLLKGNVCGGSVRGVNVIVGDLRGGKASGVNLVLGDVHDATLRGVNLVLGDLHGGQAHAVNVLIGDVHGGDLKCALLIGNVHGGTVRAKRMRGEVLGGDVVVDQRL